MFKVMLRHECGDRLLQEFHTRKAAEAEAKDWNDRHGYSQWSMEKYGTDGSAYVK